MTTTEAPGATSTTHDNQPEQEYLADLVNPTYPTEGMENWADHPSTVGDLIEALAEAGCTDIEDDEDALRIDFTVWDDHSHRMIRGPVYLKLKPCASLEEIEVLEALYAAWDAAFDAATEALADRDTPCMCEAAVASVPRRCAWNALDYFEAALSAAVCALEAGHASRGAVLDFESL